MKLVLRMSQTATSATAARCAHVLSEDYRGERRRVLGGGPLWICIGRHAADAVGVAYLAPVFGERVIAC
jgi:hypothetical protein